MSTKTFKEIDCPDCEGTGNASNDHGGNCRDCEGYGTIKVEYDKDDDEQVTKRMNGEWYTLTEYNKLADRGEYQMQEQRDRKYE
jgi:DnaJ-class molecular chaperone